MPLLKLLGANMTLGIIGYGDFGKFVHELAQEHMPEIVVRVHSLGIPADGETFFSFEEVCRADVVILAVPEGVLENVYHAIAAHLGEHTIVCDVAATKTHAIAALKKANIQRYIATHPLFGPYSYAKIKTLKGLRIAVCDSSLDTETYTVALSALRKAGMTVMEITADEHDRLVAETLFLTHFVGQVVTKGGFKRTEIDTVSFGFLMNAVESVAQDEALFRDVFTYNPYCNKVLERLEKVEKEVATMLRKEKID